jgi:putative heme transporter
VVTESATLLVKASFLMGWVQLGPAPKLEPYEGYTSQGLTRIDMREEPVEIGQAERRGASVTQRRRRILQAVFSALVVIAIFGFAFPKLADYSAVWSSIRAMTWMELASLALVALWNIFTYWFVMMASLPGSNIWQAMKVNLTSTAVANTLPGGGAIGIGVTYAMYTAYGFTTSEIALSVLVSGIWNNFVKLGMPVIALALVALQGNPGTGTVFASLIGLGVLVGAIVLFALVLRSDPLARVVGEKLGRIVNFGKRLFRKPEGASLSDSAVRFRRQTVELLKRRWVWLTLATVISHVSLFLVLLLALRHLGVSQNEVSWAEALAAFSFVRLITALPITPGGLGVVELGLTAALISAGGDDAQVAAAVLLYRALTYLLPIPIGALMYLRFTRGAEARRQRVAAMKESEAQPIEEVSG